MLSGKINFILSVFYLIFFVQCNNSATPDNDLTSAIPESVVENEKYYYYDSSNTDNETDDVVSKTGVENPEPGDENNQAIERFKTVKNLLVFHTKDTMKLDTTYSATLALGKNISLDELTDKIKKIVQPGGKIKVIDTTQDIGLQMSATLEDKAPEKDPNFSIRLVGSESNIRVYDAKKNKMVWQWNVTPLKEGLHELALSISMIDKNGIAGNPETQWYSIIIFSGGKKKESGDGFGVFLGKNWQWLISAIFIPLFIAWFTTRQRRKNEYQRASAAGEKPFAKNWRRKRK